METINKTNILKKNRLSLVDKIRLDLLHHQHCKETNKLVSLRDDEKILSSLKKVDRLNRAKVNIMRAAK